MTRHRVVTPAWLWIVSILVVIIPFPLYSQIQRPPGDEARLAAQLATACNSARGTAALVSELLNPGDGRTTVTGADPVRVAELGEQTQRTLLAGLAGPEFSALRDYVAGAFPDVPHAAAGDTVNGRPILRPPAVRQYAASLGKFVDNVRGGASLAVELGIVTHPSEADVELTTRAVKLPKVRSDATLNNVYRGRYSVVVSKPGFKSAALTVDLIDDSRPILECSLGTASDATAQSSCRRK